MMKWILLLAVIAGVLWSSNWSYHQLDRAMLITDSWQEPDASEWKLVHFKEEGISTYSFTSIQGYWPISLALWPVFTLFTLLIIVMIPLVFYIYRGSRDHQIFAAKEASKKAIDSSNIKIKQAKEKERETKEAAEISVNNAYTMQLKRVRQELVKENEKLHELKRNVEQRESKISEREHNAKKSQKEAEQNRLDIQKLLEQAKLEFEARMTEMARSRDNAQAGYQRLKNRKPKSKTVKSQNVL